MGIWAEPVPVHLSALSCRMGALLLGALELSSASKPSVQDGEALTDLPPRLPLLWGSPSGLY